MIARNNISCRYSAHCLLTMVTTLLHCFVVNTAIAGVYYNKANRGLDTLASWGLNTDGSGSAPTSFTNISDTFNVNNVTPNPALGSAWALGNSTSGGVSITLNINYTGAPVVLGNSLTIAGKNANFSTLFIASGATLDMGSNQLTDQACCGGTLTHNTYINNGTLKTANTSGTPIPSAITWGGLVNFNASGVQTIGTDTFNNLTLSGSGAKNTSGTVVNDTLMLQGTASVSTAPTYGSSAALMYNTSSYTTGAEWTSTFSSTGGVIIAGTGTVTIAASSPKTLGTSVPLTLISGSTLANNGNNISAGGNILGSGTESGSGTISMTTSGATISGATISNLTLNNSGGFSLTGSATITGLLTLSAGKLTIGSNNLTFSTSSSPLSGASSSNYIVAIGTGQVKKSYTANGSYTFQVGDGSYSPITLGVAGTSYSSASVGVNLQNAKEPHNANTTNYLNRYWTVTASGISGLTDTVKGATYSATDVAGTEASLVLGVYASALPWTKVSGSSVNTSTHTLAATGAVTSTNFNVTGINSANPSVSASASSAAICSGSGTDTLTASGSGDPTLSYSWSPSTGLSTTTAASITASPSSTTTYTVTLTDGNGFTATASKTVSVNATPASITGTTTVCGTATSTLNDATSGGTWSSSNTSIATVGSTGTMAGVAAGNATITYSVSYPTRSCYVTAPVTVNSVPTAAPSNNGPVCSASTVTLTANPGGSANTYTWTGSSLSSTTAQNPTATPTVTSTYSLTVSYGSGYPGCSPSTVYTTSVAVRSSGYWVGSTSTNWTDASNWCGGVPSSTTNVLIPGGTTYNPSITSGTDNANGVTIQSGGSITVNGGSLQIAGPISNSGTFTATNGTIVLNGSSAQTIPASTFSSNTVNNLTVNNSAGATLGGTLNISGILKVITGSLATGGYLTLLSTATQTALIDGSGSGNVTGNVTMQRYMDSSYGYKIISSPFQAATVSQMFSYINMADTFPQFYKYVENVGHTGWETDTTGTDVLQVMQGYGSNFGSSFSASTFSLNGTVNNGAITNTLYNHDSTYTLGFNCVGNPYPSPIDWSASTGWTKTNIDDAIYFYDNSDTNRYYGTYSSYIAGVSSNGRASNIISSMQGFFVHVSSGSYPVTGTLNINNNARVNNLSPAYHRTSAADIPLVRIKAIFESTGKGDPTVIYFNDNASSRQFNNHLDALKLLNTDNLTPNLYSMSDDALPMSIHALHANSDSINAVPLTLDISQDGWIIFNCSDVEHLPAGMQVYFTDVNTGVSQDISNTPVYRIYLKKGKYQRRFFVTFKPANTSPNLLLGDLFDAYSAAGAVHVNLHILSGGNGDITISDISGREFYRGKVEGYTQRDIPAPWPSGVYIVSFAGNGQMNSKKIFINNK